MQPLQMYYFTFCVGNYDQDSMQGPVLLSLVPFCVILTLICSSGEYFNHLTSLQAPNMHSVLKSLIYLNCKSTIIYKLHHVKK